MTFAINGITLWSVKFQKIVKNAHHSFLKLEQGSVPGSIPTGPFAAHYPLSFSPAYPVSYSYHYNEAEMPKKTKTKLQYIKLVANSFSVDQIIVQSNRQLWLFAKISHQIV